MGVVRACLDAERARSVTGLLAGAKLVLRFDVDPAGAVGDGSGLDKPGILLRQSTSSPEVLESEVELDFALVVLEER